MGVKTDKLRNAVALSTSKVALHGFLFLLPLMPLAAYAQSIVVYDTGDGVQLTSSGGYVYIVPPNYQSGDWPMPSLDIYLNGAKSCQTVTLDIKMAWLDAYTARETQYDTGTHTMNATDAWILDNSDWPNLGSSNNSEGGYATISYQIDNGPVQYFYFNIGGTNADYWVVDDFLSSLGPPVAPKPPWFWKSILALESGDSTWFARQYWVGNCPVPDPINVNYCPLVEGNPDGIGISQVDGESNPSYVSDSLYWNFEDNIEVGLVILNGWYTTAENNYQNQLQTSGGNPPHGVSTGHCNFSSSPQPPTSYGFGDGNWIQSYNSGEADGNFFVWYIVGSGWEFRNVTGEPGADYVPGVCNSAASF